MLLFRIKTIRVSGEDLAPIYLRQTINGGRVAIFTNREKTDIASRILLLAIMKK